MAKLVNKKSAVEDPNKLTGPEKAAVILLALGEEHTALWERLDDDEVKEISQAMATLGNVTAEAVEALMIEFVSGLSGSGSVMGSYEQTQKLLSAFLPKDRVDGLMEEIRGPAGRTMWDKLGNVNEAVLANYLKNEYPQTAAVGSPAAEVNISRRGMVMWTRAAVMPRIDMMVRDSSPCRARCSFNCCWNSVWPRTDWLSNSS